MLERHKTVIHIYGGSPKKRGSLEEYFLLLTRTLRDRGWRSLFCFDRFPDEELLQAYIDCGAELNTLRTTKSRFDFSLIRAFYKLFRNKKPAVVNVHFGHTGINGLIAARLAGVKKCIWTKHSLDAISYKKKLPLHKRWLHTINYESLWATDIVAVSQAVKRELADHSITAKVQHFYLGIDLRRFSNGKDSPQKRETLSIPVDRPIVACISQARREKGIEILVRAVAQLKNMPYCPYVLIVGGGPLTNDLKILAAGLGVSSLLNFCGVRNDVDDILAMAGFTVLPSLEDAAPLALIESLAAGKPVIASRVGGIPEFIQDDVNGILVEPGDAAGLAAAITCLCTDAARLLRLRLGATASVERFDVRRGVEETIALYCGEGYRDAN